MAIHDGASPAPLALESTLKKLRGVVKDCLQKHLNGSAVFFADKLVSMSGGDVDDVFLYCQALFTGKHHRRALTVLRREGLIGGDSGTGRSVATYEINRGAQLRDGGAGVLRFRLLAAQCLHAIGEWDECLATLGDGTHDGEEEELQLREEEELARGGSFRSRGGSRDGKVTRRGERGADDNADVPRVSLSSSLCLLRGRAYEALENRPLAQHWYKAALAADPFCYEALDALVGNHMLTVEEESSMLDSLHFGPNDEWLRFLYSAMGKKYNDLDEKLGDRASSGGGKRSSLRVLERIRSSSGDGSGAGAGSEDHTDLSEQGATYGDAEQLPPELVALGDNGDVALAQAEWLYQRGDFQRCHDVVAEVLERDPFQLSALPCYLSVTVELRRKSDLFLCAHKLVEEYPERAVSWFAVACYYYCVRQFDTARRYFSKATSLEGAFVPAWIGFGHSFAAQDESDQAMAAYRTAARLFPGCHLPVLCIGMEYQRTNNLSLAEHFFGRAREICPSDPLVYNELGVLAYRNRDYTTAVSFLERAISLVPQPLTDRWEATVVNLAHANRKLNNFDDAIAWYERALSLAPRVASTYTALGFTHQLKGNFQSHMGEAIECYHKALGLRPDDTFAQEMLTLALIDQCAVTMPPYNHVSLDPYQPLPFVSRDGFDKIEVDSGEAGGEGIPEAEVIEEEEEDDDMDMSP